MQPDKQWIALLLAGGQGSRLQSLTHHLAKPAVHFGGKYRIIDFALTNCVHSGVDTVGVLTQYQPLQLNHYIGGGQPWDLDRTHGGIHLLPPYQQSQGGEWYCGTANAVYQNLPFITRYNPTYVLVLSADHIYKMDYRPMLHQHQATGAACTIASLQVPPDQASRFGIITTRADGRITGFVEKPSNPPSTCASMGVYLFNTQTLVDRLAADAANPQSTKDFGRDVIPGMLADGLPLYAYRFDGYWKDVGTVESLWQAHMDLLAQPAGINLYDPAWRVYFRHTPTPAQYIGPQAVIHNALIAEGCQVEGHVSNTVLSGNVRLAAGARVRHSVLMPGTQIGAGSRVDYAIVDAGAVIGRDCRVGHPDGRCITLVPGDANLPDGSLVADPPG